MSFVERHALTPGGTSTAGQSMNFVSHSQTAVIRQCSPGPDLLAYQNLLIAIAGVTEAGVLWPLGMIHTPRMAPVLGLQLYSIAGAKPTSRLPGLLVRMTGPPPVACPRTLVCPAKSASTSNPKTHSLVRLY